MLRPAALVLALACVRVINVVAQTVPATNASARGRACGAQPNFPFCNTTLDAEDRITDLIARLQKNEIVPQLQARHGGGGSPAPASNVSRIGLPEYGEALIEGVLRLPAEGADCNRPDIRCLSLSAFRMHPECFPAAPSSACLADHLCRLGLQLPAWRPIELRSLAERRGQVPNVICEPGFVRGDVERVARAGDGRCHR